MPWYVFAFVDAAPSGAKGKGLSGPLGLRRVPGGFAVVERRADVPPAEFGSLKRHHDVVARLASRVPAIIPVRFGTLLDDDGIHEALDERGEDLAAAFAAVRDRVQLTWRRRPRVDTQHPKIARRRPTTDVAAESGRDYLRRVAKAANPAPPAAWRVLRAKLKPLISAERYQAGSGSVPEALYHLVGRDQLARYSTVAAGLCHADAALTMTGPWPPFAFVAEKGSSGC